MHASMPTYIQYIQKQHMYTTYIYAYIHYTYG